MPASRKRVFNPYILMTTGVLGGGVSGPDLTTGLVSWWKLDEESGTRADSVGSNHLTSGSAGFTADGVSANTGNAADFTPASSNRLGTASNPTTLAGGDRDYSFGGWFKFDIIDGSHEMFTKRVTSIEYELIRYVSDNRFRLIIGGMTGQVYGNVSPNVDTWYFVVAGFIAATKTAWISVNDQPRATAVLTGTPTANTDVVQLARGANNAFLDGKIDEAFFYAKYLDDAMIAALYNGGQGVTYPFDAAPTAGLRITSPTQYQSLNDGSPLPVSGYIQGMGTKTIEGRFNSGSWETIASGVSGSFSGTLASQVTGIGTLEVRTTDEAYSHSVADVDYGDTFSVISSRTLIDASVNTLDWVGRPSLVECADGTWISAIRRGDTHGNDPDGDISLIFSDDEGITWTEPNVFLDGNPVTGAPFTVQNANAIAVIEVLLIPCPNSDVLALVKERTLAGTRQYRSTNYGATWVDEGEINDDITLIAAEDYCVIGSDIYLAARYDPNGDFTHPHYARLYKSTDNGASATWTLLSTVSASLDVNEIGLANPSGTKLTMVIRNENDKATAYAFDSPDLTPTWGSQRHLALQIGVHQRPRMITTADGTLLFGREVDNETGDTWIVIYLSTDDCQTFRRKLRIAGPYEDCGYSAVLEKTNGDYYMQSYGGTFDAANLVDFIVRLG